MKQILKQKMAQVNRNLKRVGALCIWASLLLVVGSCGPTVGGNPLTDVDAPVAIACYGTSCPPDRTELLIQVANPDPVLLLQAEPSVDISGFCDSAGYPTTKIYYEVQDNGASVIAITDSGEVCDEQGRFTFNISLAPLATRRKLYTVTVKLVGVNADASEDENPSGENMHQFSLTCLDFTTCI